MVIKQEVAYGIVHGLADFWKCEELQDFTVTIETSEFKCHRLLLAACSEFFRGLFRSGMKETEQKCVSIEDISSETFELIMESMYTGHDILTYTNVLDIWRAAHQLQIHFLVSECENFVIENVSLYNYVEYLQTCKALDSKFALGKVWSFIHKNGNCFFQTCCFLELPFAEVLSLVKCQDLETNSEDDVIQAILKWVDFQEVQFQPQCLSVKEADPTNVIQLEEEKCDNVEVSSENSRKNNDVDSLAVSINTDASFKTETCDNEGNVTSKNSRMKYLTELLSHARTCLASKMCLKMLTEHPLTKDDKEIKDIVIDGLFNQFQVGTINGQWTNKAVHRNNSNFTNCLVKAKKLRIKAEIYAFSFQKKKWLSLPDIVDVTNVKLVAVGTKLFAMCNSTHTPDLVLCQLEKGGWAHVNIFPAINSIAFSVAAVESFLFIYPANESTMFKLDSTLQHLTEISGPPVYKTCSHMVPYNQWILVFYASNVKSVDETLVQCYDTLLNTWNQLKNLEGPAKGMTSFKDDHFTYLLQSNGDLWKVVMRHSNIIDFEFMFKLWSCDLSIYGAVTFMDELYIHCDYAKNEEPRLQRFLQGVFSKINYINNNNDATLMSIPITLETHMIYKKIVY